MTTAKSRFASPKVTDANITVGSRAYDTLHRNRLEYDRAKLLEDALRAYRCAGKVLRIYLTRWKNAVSHLHGRDVSLMSSLILLQIEIAHPCQGR